MRLPALEVITAGRGKIFQRQYVETVLSVVGKAMSLPWKKGITALRHLSMLGPPLSMGKPSYLLCSRHV